MVRLNSLRSMRFLAFCCMLWLAGNGAAVVPSNHSIVEAGAVLDGRTLSTATINRVIGAVSATGGKTAVVPAGLRLTP